MTRRLSLLALALLLLPGSAESKKQAAAAAAPPVGWTTMAATKSTPAWRGSCWMPPDWASMSDTDRRQARQQALEAMSSQWSGQKEDFVSFDANLIELVTDTLLGRPEQIEAVASTNADYCKKVMAEGADTSAWKTWLAGLTSHLNEGQCVKPLDYTLTQYLSVDTGWQERIPICKDDRVIITATVKDMFRLSHRGAWLDVDGDKGDPAAGSTLPCNVEGCFRGQLIGLFESLQGVQTIFPIGASKRFTAPEHGFLSFRINDDSPEDNQWRTSGAVTDHTAVTIAPAN
jgi:hypothetical protein